MKKTIVLAFLLFAVCLPVRAQYFAIPWFKIGGGGGAMTGGNFYVNGTIGQADTGNVMTGGNYVEDGGFWVIVLVTAGAPTLYISHSNNTVTVYWQSVPGWNLYQNSSLTMPSNWTASSGITTTNGTNYLIVSPPTGNLFFRLQAPLP